MFISNLLFYYFQTNAAEESLRIALDAIPRSQCEVSRSALQKIKDSLSRALGVIGDGLGCGTSSENPSHVVVEPSRSRPRDKILSRGVRGMKRGGSRRMPPRPEAQPEPEPEPEPDPDPEPEPEPQLEYQEQDYQLVVVEQQQPYEFAYEEPPSQEECIT